MSLPTLSFYQVAFEPTPPLLRGASLRPVSAEEVTASAELLLAAARQHQCAYWLLDGCHHQREQPLALHRWMQEEFFPRVQVALCRRPCVAFLVPQFIWEGLGTKGYEHPHDWQTLAVRMGWFTDEPQAWLSGQRT